MALKDRSFHPANLALRLLIELGSLIGLALFAFHRAPADWSLMLAVAVPVMTGTMWALFNVPGDRSRSGNAPVAVSGPTRLVMELIILYGGAAAYYGAGHWLATPVMTALVTIHYLASPGRVRWLWRQRA